MSRQNIFYAQDNFDQQVDHDPTPIYSRQNSKHQEPSANVHREEPRSPRIISSRTLSTQELSRSNNGSHKEIPYFRNSFLTRDGSSNQVTAERSSFRKLRSNTGINELEMGGDIARISSRSPNLQNRSLQEVDKHLSLKGNLPDSVYKQKNSKPEPPTDHSSTRDIWSNKPNHKYPVVETQVQPLNYKLMASIRNGLGLQEARELDAYLQKIHLKTSILTEENIALKSQIEHIHNLNNEYQQNQLNLSEKNFKLESVIKNIREENRALRTQVQDLSIIAQSNKTAEELFSKLEEEKRHSQALMAELKNVKGQLVLGQQAYLELVNEFNKTKLMTLRQKSAKKTSMSRLPESLQSELVPHKSTTKYDDDDAESQIINENIKNMFGSINNVTLDSRFAGTSNILMKKLDSTFNYGTQETTKQATGHEYAQFLSHNNQQILSTYHGQKNNEDSGQHHPNQQSDSYGQGLLSGQYKNQSERNYHW